jgi:hypothetical protein
LKDVVQKMDLLILLRNAPPTYRGTFALTLMNEKQISKDECKKFVKLVGK